MDIELRRVVVRGVTGLAALMLSAGALHGQAGIQTRQVQFPAGASSTEIKGQIKGDQTIDYVVRASAGQSMSVAMKGSNGAGYFNVLPPGSSDVAMHNSSMNGDFKAMLPADGDYKVRVYLMRSAARRNETSNFTLSVGVTGKPLAALPAAQDAKIKGTPFHASANISCVAPYDPAAAKCEASVVRRGRDTTGTVEVRGPNGYRRTVLIVAGKFAAADTVEPVTVTRAGDVIKVSVGSNEKFEFPDVLLIGG